MCRSSRIFSFLVAIVALAPMIAASTPVHARGLAFHVGIGARPMIALPRVTTQPGLRFGVHPGLGRGLGDGRGRFGRGFGGYGGYDTGLALGLAGDGLAPPLLPDGGDGPGPQWRPVAAPPPCVRPLIITIGSGLRHAVRSKVVYGAPPPCG